MMLSKYTTKNSQNKKGVYSSANSKSRKDVEPDYVPKRAFAEQKQNIKSVQTSGQKRLAPPAIMTPNSIQRLSTARCNRNQGDLSRNGSCGLKPKLSHCDSFSAVGGSNSGSGTHANFQKSFLSGRSGSRETYASRYCPSARNHHQQKKLLL